MRKVQDSDGFPSVARGGATTAGVAAFPWNRWQLCRGISGSFPVERVAGLAWNQWQLCRGTGGSFAVESVAGFPWNRWQLSRGIRNGDCTISWRAFSHPPSDHPRRPSGHSPPHTRQARCPQETLACRSFSIPRGSPVGVRQKLIPWARSRSSSRSRTLRSPCASASSGVSCRASRWNWLARVPVRFRSVRATPVPGPWWSFAARR